MSSNKKIYFEKGEDYQPRMVGRKSRRSKSKTPPQKAAEKQRQAASKERERTFEEFSADLDSTPIYYISAHSCLCVPDRRCYREEYDPIFQIPDDTYILSFAQVNDFTCTEVTTENSIMKHSDSLRKYLLLQSTSDLLDNPNVGTTDFSLFNGITRATSPYTAKHEPTLYPNVAFTFNEKEKGEENFAGVYAIDEIKEFHGLHTLNNTVSIIKEDPARKNFFLKDIIQEVYKKTGKSKGIFIVGGCLLICGSSDVKQKESEAAAKKFANMINIANNYYNSLRTTWTQDELVKMGYKDVIPKNVAIKEPTTGLDVDEVIAMHKAGLIDATTLVQYLPALLHPDDRVTLKRKLRIKSRG
jgi:hypothetical protein